MTFQLVFIYNQGSLKLNSHVVLSIEMNRNHFIAAGLFFCSNFLRLSISGIARTLCTTDIVKHYT